MRDRTHASNVAILLALVNGAGITKITRMMAPSGSGRSCGAKRVYDRIFWLEKTLLAFERVQLAKWRAEREASGERIRHHLAHDDVIITVNWETSDDRRLTQLNCSATADVRSGYVYRIDTDSDPTVDPVSLVEGSYVDRSPTGRFEEHHLFAAAAHQLSLFRDQMVEGMPEETPPQQTERATAISEIEGRIALIRTLHEDYFNVQESQRDHRTPFTGIMTRDVFTKAAHWTVLREQLPAGEFKIITEQEGILPRVLPHIFREEIEADRFRWIAMTFDKEVKKPEMQARVSAYKADLERFLDGLRRADPNARRP